MIAEPGRREKLLPRKAKSANCSFTFTFYLVARSPAQTRGGGRREICGRRSCLHIMSRGRDSGGASGGEGEEGQPPHAAEPHAPPVGSNSVAGPLALREGLLEKRRRLVHAPGTKGRFFRCTCGGEIRVERYSSREKGGRIESSSGDSERFHR